VFAAPRGGRSTRSSCNTPWRLGTSVCSCAIFFGCSTPLSRTSTGPSAGWACAVSGIWIPNHWFSGQNGRGREPRSTLTSSRCSGSGRWVPASPAIGSRAAPLVLATTRPVSLSMTPHGGLPRGAHRRVEVDCDPFSQPCCRLAQPPGD